MPNHWKVLVVDDEASFRKYVTRILEDSGYGVFTAANATEALNTLQKNQIALCLLDIVMPGMRGNEFLRKIRSTYPDVSIMMSTGVSNLEMAINCRADGAEDYLVKPFEPERLLISIHNTLDRKRLQQENNFYRSQLEKRLEEKSQKLKDSQTMLIQQEKLAAIGQLAAGVAHEINNPLGFISGNLRSLQKYFIRILSYKDEIEKAKKGMAETEVEALVKVEKELKIDYIFEDLAELIDDSLTGTDRIKEIINSLRSFSRTDDDSPSHLDINACLENAITVVWNEIKYNSELVHDFADLPFLEGYPQQLSQVFMNLLVNASHAIKEKGVIHIKTATVDGEIHISIRDNGCGIPSENLTRIFDPFFTTKPSGKGTGLGMSIACEIVKKHNGYIDVESAVGEGTEFTIKLPLPSAPQ